jgi:CcmD family protein
MRHSTLATFGLIALVLILVFAAPLASIDVGGQEGFVTVKPGDQAQERLPATPLVFAAYAFVWVALLVYVFVLWRRIGRVERELVDLVAGRRPAAGGAEGPGKR